MESKLNSMSARTDGFKAVQSNDHKENAEQDGLKDLDKGINRCISVGGPENGGNDPRLAPYSH